MAFTKIVGAGIATDTDVQVDDILAGIVTATRFDGDGSQLSGLPGGLGTALSSDSTSALSAIYTNDRILSIGATITIDVPDSSAGAYTQYTDIVVDADADLIVADGDDFIPDILGLSTSGPAEPLAGGGGRIRADNITNKAGTGAVNFPSGVNASGITTVAELHVGVDTGFFTEDLVVNGSARITGIFTVGRDTLIFDGAKNSITVGSGVTIDGSSGIITATRFVGDGSNLSGIDATALKDSDGNVIVQAEASGLVITGIATVTSGKLMVGNAYVDATAVGVGTTDTTGRDAGIGTMVGSMIYNETLGAVQIYKRLAGWTSISATGDSPPPPPDGITATGGLISDYESGGDYYRAHIFTGSGTFQITELSPNVPFNQLDYLVVAGGGGGGVGGDETLTSYQAGGGGGGAGGLKSSDPTMPAPLKASTVTGVVGSYAVTVGAGGQGGYGNLGPSGRKAGQLGSDSSWAAPGGTITSTGGGAGQGAPGPIRANGGSGGGGEGWTNGSTKSGGNGDGPQGNAGGSGSGNPAPPGQRYGGGGGGAGAAGNPGEPSTPEPTRGRGGVGLELGITGTTQGYAGGGTAGRYSPGPAYIPGPPIGGGGQGQAQTFTPSLPQQTFGTRNTGGGGGGGHSPTSDNRYAGGNGGSGVVVIKYQITAPQTGTAKATGGVVSFNGGKTIHTFTNSGTFTIPAPVGTLACDYLLVGGGGAGANNNGGGGGGGGVVFGPALNIAVGSYPVVIGAGAVGATGWPAPTSPQPMFEDGTATTFNSMTAGGGGRGGTLTADVNGNPGGSSTGASGGTAYGAGGGGGGYTSPGSSGGSASGGSVNNTGGSGGNGHPGGYAPAGGGGAGGDGFNSLSSPSVGGIGVENSILGTPYYWGGGGGPAAAGPTNPQAGAGGIGGGGGGSGTNTANGGAGGAGLNPGTAGSDAPGSINHVYGGDGGLGTGGGGGGAGAHSNGGTNVRGGNGGSGIVIVAYPT